MKLDPIGVIFACQTITSYLIVMEIHSSEVGEKHLALVCKCVPVQQKADKHWEITKHLCGDLKP